MIKEGLNDDECPEQIRQFVRAHEHIRFEQWKDNGHNGIVYFGTSLKMQEDVVIKFYIANKGYDSSEEAIILRRIDHPNVLRVDLIRFLEPFNTFFLSPKISGGDLQGLIDSSQTISSSRALGFVQGILNGLSELHSTHNLVHRDLKPANILFRLEDDSAVLADLGSVKKIDDATGYVTASKSTRVYLPPEAIVENKYDYQSDIYQVGIVLFQLLGGYFPLNNPLEFLTTRERAQLKKIVGDSMAWERKRSEFINGRITSGKLINLDTLPNYLDQRFKRVIRRAIHPDSSRRYNNVSEFLTDVNGLIRDFPDYNFVGHDLFVTHLKGASYLISQNGHNSYVLQKMMTNGNWRKNNKHDGSLNSVLRIANSK